MVLLFGGVIVKPFRTWQLLCWELFFFTPSTFLKRLKCLYVLYLRGLLKQAPSCY